MHLDDDIVARALADIGEPSIPTVSEFLKDTNSKVRRRAVLILLNINNAESRMILQQHFPNETDPRIRALIGR